MPQWLRWAPGDLPNAQALSSRHAPDVTAELAALTGTVLHNHHAAPQQAQHSTRQQYAQQQKREHAAPWARPAAAVAPAAFAEAAFAEAEAAFAAADAAALRPAALEPEPTVTTTSLGALASRGSGVDCRRSAVCWGS